MRERIEAIVRAMELIEEARGMVENAVRGTSQESHFEAYGKYGFNQLLGEGNPYDSSLHSLVEFFSDEGNVVREIYSNQIEDVKAVSLVDRAIDLAEKDYEAEKNGRII